MHWLGPFQVDHNTKASVVKLKNLQAMPLKGIVNGNQLNPYTSS